jgi:hypothetical protein
MDTISQPVGGRNPAAEGKLGKGSHEEKTSVVFFLAAVMVRHIVGYMGIFTPIWCPESFGGHILGFLIYLVKSGHCFKKFT